jgi:excisionase family DNA binding protein
MKLLTLTQVAQMLSISDSTARKLAAELPGVKLGKRTRYTEASVLAFVQAGGCGAKSAGQVAA